MKTLVVYYSRTGFTKLVAEMIADKLGADCKEIIDKTDRKGVLGYLKAARDAMQKKKTKIARLEMMARGARVGSPKKKNGNT